MKILPLLERRRNADHPSQQTRDYRGIEAIKQKYADTGHYVTFTQVAKVGVNPKSEYSTPLGIYSYSTKYISTLDSIVDVPFAGESANLYVMKPTVDVLYLSKYDNLEADKAKLMVYSKETHVGESMLKAWIENVRPKSSHTNKAASVMWTLVRRLSQHISEGTDREENIVFNTILRKVLGYRIIDDDEGQGIIHPSEEFQCVFLDKGALQVVDKIKNEDGYHDVEHDPIRKLENARKSPEYREADSEFQLAYKVAYADMIAFNNKSESIFKKLTNSYENDNAREYETSVDRLNGLGLPGGKLIAFVDLYVALDGAGMPVNIKDKMSSVELSELELDGLIQYDNAKKLNAMCLYCKKIKKYFNDVAEQKLITAMFSDYGKDD